MSRFHVVAMPINAEGQGPASPSETVTTLWQVWDHFGMTDDDSFGTQAEAIEWCMLCNEVAGVGDDT